MILLYTMIDYVAGRRASEPSLRLRQKSENFSLFVKKKWKVIKIVAILYFRNLL